MGTDIHAQIEFKYKGEWHWLLKGINPMIRISGEINPVGFDRSYNLFGILANVRNGSGFAGCDTGDGFNFIQENRGLPEDLSTDLREKLKEDDYIFGEHNIGYVTNKELEEFDWEQVTKKRGFVSASGYKEFLEKGEPSGWCGGTSRDAISNSEMDKRIKTVPLEEIDEYTQIEWEVRYLDAIPWDYYYRLTNLKDLFDWDLRGKIEEVRIVFGFDS